MKRVYKEVPATKVEDRQRKQPHRFVVGYASNSQDAVYSKRVWAFKGEGGLSAMTLRQAQTYVSALSSDGHKAYIYELVPILSTRV